MMDNRDDIQITDANRVFRAAAMSAYAGMSEDEMIQVRKAVKALSTSIRGISEAGAIELLAKIGIELAGRKIEFSHAMRDTMKAVRGGKKA